MKEIEMSDCDSSSLIDATFLNEDEVTPQQSSNSSSKKRKRRKKKGIAVKRKGKRNLFGSWLRWDHARAKNDNLWKIQVVRKSKMYVKYKRNERQKFNKYLDKKIIRYVVEVMKDDNLKFSLNGFEKWIFWNSFCFQGISAADTFYFDTTTLKKITDQQSPQSNDIVTSWSWVLLKL